MTSCAAMRRALITGLAIAALAVGPAAAPAAVQLEPVGTLREPRPMSPPRRATAAASRSSSGRARCSSSSTASSRPTPLLDITGRVSSCAGERGLLSVAFAPDYATSGAALRLLHGACARRARSRSPSSTARPTIRIASMPAASASSCRSPTTCRATTTAASYRSGPTARCTRAPATAARAATRPATGRTPTRSAAPSTQSGVNRDWRLAKLLRIDRGLGVPRRSTPTGCATRSASPSTARPATC